MMKGRIIQQHYFFRLSAISAALFGLFSQGYAVECQIPMTIDNQKGAVLTNCKIDDLEYYDGSRFSKNLLMSIKNSDVTISDTHINYRTFSSYGQGILDVSDSKILIKDSQMRSYTPPQGFLIKAENSEINVQNSTLKGGGAVKIFNLKNGKVDIESSHISYIDTYGSNVFMLHQENDSTINIHNSTIEATRFLSDDREYRTVPTGIFTFNINKSKVLAERLFQSASGNNSGSIEFNLTDSELKGRMIMSSETGIPLNVKLNNSEWTVPYSARSRENSVNHLMLNNGKVILPVNTETYPPEKQVFQNFIVFGNLSGSGHFSLTTDLANQQSDKIIVKGKDSGDFTLGIQDSGNEPQAENGKVTLIETQTGQAKFSLKEKDYVDAGVYRYRLHQEGTNWVLSNQAGEKGEYVKIEKPVKKPIDEDFIDPEFEEEVDEPITTPTVENSHSNSTPTTLSDTINSDAIPSVSVVVTPEPEAVITKPTVQPEPNNVGSLAPTAMSVLSEKSNALVSLRQAQGVFISQNLQGIHQRLGELKTDKASNVWVKDHNSRHKAKAQNVAADSRASGFELDSYRL